MSIWEKRILEDFQESLVFLREVVGASPSPDLTADWMFCLFYDHERKCKRIAEMPDLLPFSHL